MGTSVPLLIVKEAALPTSVRHKGQRKVTNHHSPGCTRMVLGWNRNSVSEENTLSRVTGTKFE